MKREIIVGLNPVLEAIAAGRPVRRVLVSRESDRDRIADLARRRRIPVEFVTKRRLDEIYGGPHQGILAIAAPRAYARLSDVLEGARGRGEDPFLVLLDGVEDPHNLGAVARTALAAGAHGIVVPEREAAGISPGAHKASAGALARIPVVLAVNLATAIRELKRENVWIGVAEASGKPWDEVSFTGPLALVLGGEARGVRKLPASLADFSVALPMRAGESLNVSVAAGILFYERMRQQRAKGKGQGSVRKG